MSQERGRVLVTGGTSGIGLEISARFAAEGFHVTAAGLDPEQGEQQLADAVRRRKADAPEPPSPRARLGAG